MNRTLSNPPGPRMPTSLMHNQNYQRQPKPSHILADGNANKAAQMMRKRKIDGGQDDGMCLPAKSKFPPHSEYLRESRSIFIIIQSSNPHDIPITNETPYPNHQLKGRASKPKPPRLIDPFAAKRKGKLIWAPLSFSKS